MGDSLCRADVDPGSLVDKGLGDVRIIAILIVPGQARGSKEEGVAVAKVQGGDMGSSHRTERIYITMGINTDYILVLRRVWNWASLWVAATSSVERIHLESFGSKGIAHHINGVNHDIFLVTFAADRQSIRAVKAIRRVATNNGAEGLGQLRCAIADDPPTFSSGAPFPTVSA